MRIMSPTTTWVALVAATIVSFAAAESAPTAHVAATVAILIGALKARLIFINFMELEYRPLRLAYENRSSFQDFSFDVPAGTRLTPAGPVAFPGGTDKLQFDQPPVATAGVAYRVIAPLLLAFDLEWIKWSDTFGHNLPKYTSDVTRTGSLPLDTSWGDQLVYKIGAEVALSQAVKVRAGFNHGKTPLDASRAVENILLPAVTEDHFTVGLGWSATDALSVNLAGMYSPRAKLSGSNLGQGIVAYETSMEQYAVDLGVAWRY